MAPPGAAQLAAEAYEQACARRRSRCALETEHSHGNLAEYLAAALPGWTIVEPPEGVVPPSGYPEVEAEGAMEAAVARLGEMTGLAPAAAEDRINGHCETCAAVLTEAVLQALHAGPAEGRALAEAYAGLAARLQAAGAAGAVELLFEPEQRAARGRAAPAPAPAPAPAREELMWAPLLGRAAEPLRTAVQASPPAAAALDCALHALTAGFPGVPEVLQRVAAACAAGEASYGAVPLYILNYVWDGDDLTDQQLQAGQHETAQYSLHVVGLVLDARATVAYIADPNGPVIKGGSMEFLSLPVRRLPRGTRPSVHVSRFDRDEAQRARAEKAAKRKAKAPGAAPPGKKGKK